MKANFKPLGIAAAVAAASVGYAGAVNAQTVAAETELGDLALVPYYTVEAGYATGINITNTSATTQAVKIRFRRATDSMDAMDFNVVLSPFDVYSGFIALEGDGETITFTSNDNSCTIPDYDYAANKFEMPSIYRPDAETGYVEVIAMGSAADGTPVAIAAKHDSAGMPANCGQVRDNFRYNATGVATGTGVIDPTTTHQTNAAGTGVEASNWDTPGNALKVQYFIKSDATGVEFGDNAVHVADFIDGATITNQQVGVF